MMTKVLMLFICIISTGALISMEPTKPEKQSMIEFFTGIKKQNYDLLPKEQKKWCVDDSLRQFLLSNNQPWYYVEHAINDGAVSICFSDDDTVVSAGMSEVKYFDIKTGNNTQTFFYKKADCYDEVCFSRNGNQLAMVGQRVGKIFDIQKKVLFVDTKFKFSCSGQDMNAICFNDEEKQLAVLSLLGHKLIFFDAMSGKEVWSTCLKSELFVSTLCFDNKNHLLAMGGNKGVLINKVLGNEQLKDCLMIPGNYNVASLCFNHNGTLLAAACYNGYVNFLDPLSGKCLYSLFFDEWTRALCFDKNSQRLAIASNPNTAKIMRILNQYNDFTLDQLMLRRLMTLFLQVKKPEAGINSVNKLFKKMALLFCLDKQELNQVWFTFPDFMRVAITKTMATIIARYGKNKKNENCVVS